MSYEYFHFLTFEYFQGLEYLKDARFIKSLEIEENRWGIRIKVVEEWEENLNKLLGYYNKKDLRYACEEFWCGKGDIIDKFCCETKLSSLNNMISLDELWKWVKPQLEPPIWKRIFGFVNNEMKIEYEQDKNTFEDDLNYLKRSSGNFLTIVDNDKKIKHNEEANENKEKNWMNRMASKKDIIGLIIAELRKVNEADKDKGKRVILIKHG